MEKRFMNSLNHLTIEATRKLLDETAEMRLSNRQRRRIKASVLEKTGLKKKQGFHMSKKLAACIAGFVVILLSLPIVGLDTVAAAINKLFTFIPGVGITVKNDDAIYVMTPIVGQTKAGSAKAAIVSAVYSNDYLTVTVEVNGTAVECCDAFSLYINQEWIDLVGEPKSLCSSTESAMLYFSHKTEPPAEDDLFEIAVEGFPERLSFHMAPCLDYGDIREIGPTDIQNGISITTTANRIDNQLIVWCYPFRTANATKDRILGIGLPANGAFYQERYLQTENGQIFQSRSGLHINERLVFNMLENNHSATLHIPYLSMLRNEKMKLRVNLPTDYEIMESDASIACSLGIIRVTEIARKPNEHGKDKDTVMIKLAFDSNYSNQALYSFDFQVAGRGYTLSAIHCNAETGCTEYLEVYVGKNDSKASLNITGLYYYLFGEYVIPQEIR